jgi:DnaK suppressor protein
MATKIKKKAKIPRSYRPKEGEKFMNPVMIEYFRRKLQGWKEELLRDSNETIQDLQTESLHEADIADRASAETDRSLMLRTRDRERKLISKIDSALNRLDEGSYGYCEETMEPISLQRLEARPIATLSIEAQERHERMERTHRGD